jgi:hypothetical protein
MIQQTGATRMTGRCGSTRRTALGAGIGKDLGMDAHLEIAAPWQPRQNGGRSPPTMRFDRDATVRTRTTRPGMSQARHPW